MGALLDDLQTVAFIVSQAPTRWGGGEHTARGVAADPNILQRCSGLVLALASAHGYRRLVLAEGASDDDSEFIEDELAKPRGLLQIPNVWKHDVLSL